MPVLSKHLHVQIVFIDLELVVKSDYKFHFQNANDEKKFDKVRSLHE